MSKKAKKERKLKGYQTELYGQKIWVKVYPAEKPRDGGRIAMPKPLTLLLPN